MPRVKHCGQKFALPNCSEMYDLEYTVDDISNIIFYYFHRNYRIKQFVMDQCFNKEWNNEVFKMISSSIREKIKFILEKKEKKDDKFSHSNLNSFVVATVYYCMLDEFKYDNKNEHVHVVSDDIIMDLRRCLPNDNIDRKRLLQLIPNALSLEDKQLLNKIQNIPGYKGVKFEIKEGKLKMRIYETDIIDLYLRVMS